MLSSVSLFSGCLGLDLGFEQAGITAAAFVEKDAICQQTIRLNRPGIPLYDDIFTITGKQLLADLGRAPDVVVGGPPCQSFSTIGKRGALQDTRGLALLEYIRLVGELQPRCFVMENVRGLLSAKRDDKPLMPWIVSKFKRLGYEVIWQLVNAADYGVAQNRLRVIVIGAKDALVMFPLPTTPGRQQRTLRAAIGDLVQSPGPCGAFGAKMQALLQKVPAGGSWRNLSVQDQNRALGNADRSTGGLTSYYRRLAWNRPCPTLLTSPTQRATPLCHPTVTRPLSVNEYRRIQGFPDDWLLAGSIAQQYKQLGNAVPVNMAQAIGKAVVCSTKKESC